MTGDANSENLRETIIEALRKHPEGLTISGISENVGRHRHTVTKYVYELIGSRKIVERNVGAAKLCYLKESYRGGRTWKGQAQIAALFMLLVLVPATVIVAQNATNSSGLEGMLVAHNLTDVNSSIEDILNDTAEAPLHNATGNVTENTSGNTENLTAEANATISPNGTAPDTAGETSSNESGNNTAEETNTTITGNTTEAVSDTNETLNITNTTVPEGPSNVTANETNTTVPDLPSVNVTDDESNVTINVTEDNETANITEPPDTEINGTGQPEQNDTVQGKPEISLELLLPEKATRGSEFEVHAVADNRGTGPARSLRFSWSLPDGFFVTEGEIDDNCGTVEPGTSCTSTLLLYAARWSSLGPGGISAEVSYEA